MGGPPVCSSTRHYGSLATRRLARSTSGPSDWPISYEGSRRCWCWTASNRSSTLPAKLKVRGGISKVLLRRWLGERAPARIARRPKKGFGAPLGRWFRGELKELVGDTLSAAAVKRQGLLNPEPVARLLQEHWTGVVDRRKEIFNLLTLALWLEFVQSRSGRIVESENR